MASEKLQQEQEKSILHIMVIGFHHQKGSTVEFTFPPLGSDHVTHQSLTSILPSEWRQLPHLALPDGSHNYENDSVYFTLPMPSKPTQCVYGVACCRQIPTHLLNQVDSDVTRTTVQKSVCVLCKYPAFKSIQSKLELVTHAYFNYKDFSDIRILHEAYDSMNTSITATSSLSGLYLDLSQRDLVLHYQHRLLQIVKALLLQKRVLVFGCPANRVCNEVLAIAALMPLSLERQCNPEMQCTDEYGFPLVVFEPLPSSLRPYVCLQQMDSLFNSSQNDDNEGYRLAGVVNPLFEKQQRRVCDVFVNIEEGLIFSQDPQTRSQLHLTNADLRFTSHLTANVQERSSDAVESTTFHGSSEWIRAQFKLYLRSLLATSQNGDDISMDEFNRDFASAWLKSEVYDTWKKMAKKESIMKVKPCHPCEGDLMLGEVKRLLVTRASDYGLNVPSREGVVQETQRILTETAGRVSGVVSSAWSTASSTVYSWWSGERQQEEKEEKN